MQAHRPGEILVVDKDSDFLSFAATTLTQRGHKVRVCARAEEGRHLVGREFFDAVLCGMQLSDATGLEFCAWVKGQEELQGLPVALLVEASSLSLSSEAPTNIKPDAGADLLDASGPLAPDDFILRDVRAEEFVIRVGALLKLRRYREEIGNTITALLSVAEGIEEQDRRARGHCKRLSIMAVLLGSALGSDDYALLTLERAGYLHDIGKVSIPGAMLEKLQALTPREMEIIKGHSILGEKLCRPVMALQPVLPIIRHHHERGDGTGYPDRLNSTQIPRLAQIFSVVDVYDSLRTWRPYRPALSGLEAAAVLRNEADRGFWNRAILDIFVHQIVPTLDDYLDASHVLWPAI
jgi:putative two-component system response regulator